jgi:hypothetical protein
MLEDASRVGEEVLELIAFVLGGVEPVQGIRLVRP